MATFWNRRRSSAVSAVLRVISQATPASAHRVVAHRGAQRLIEVPQQVIGRLEPDGEPDQFRAHSGRRELGVAQLLVGGRCGVNDEAPGIAHVGQVRKELQRLDEPASGHARIATRRLEPERKNGAGAPPGTSAPARGRDGRTVRRTTPTRPPDDREGNSRPPGAFAVCRSIRSESVSRPWSSRNALVGERQAPCPAASPPSPSSGSRSAQRCRRT